MSQFKAFFSMINTCPKLKMVTTYALAYGNYMNGQSNRGANFGFGLSDLLAACSITSDDGSTNLLAYIIGQVEKDHPKIDYSDVKQEIGIAKFAKGSEIEGLKKPISDIRTAAEVLQEAIQGQ